MRPSTWIGGGVLVLAMVLAVLPAYADDERVTISPTPTATSPTSSPEAPSPTPDRGQCDIRPRCDDGRAVCRPVPGEPLPEWCRGSEPRPESGPERRHRAEHETGGPRRSTRRPDPTPPSTPPVPPAGALPETGR